MAKLEGTARQKVAKKVALENELAAQTNLIRTQANRAMSEKQADFDKQDREDFKKFIEQKLADIEAGEVDQEAVIEQAFNEGFLKEGERNKTIRSVQLAAANAKVALTEATEGRESAAYRKAYKEREKLQKDHHKAELDEKRKAAKAKFDVEQAGLSAASDVLGFTLQLLDQDGDARKKHHGLYVTLAAAKIIVDGTKEVQAIWEYSAEQPENSLTAGVFGTVLAGVQTALAVGRTAVALSKIGAGGGGGEGGGSYWMGGATGDGGGLAVSPMGQLLQMSGMSVDPSGRLQDGSGFAVAGVVHEDEYVIPKWQRADPQVAAVEQWLEARRVRGFADGGPTGTGSSGAALPIAAASPATDGEKTYAVQTQMLAALLQLNERLAGVEQWQRELNVNLNLGAAKQGLDLLAQVRQNSAIRSAK